MDSRGPVTVDGAAAQRRSGMTTLYYSHFRVLTPGAGEESLFFFGN
jgi:hypothetical protein